jgi:hypothetical protein
MIDKIEKIKEIESKDYSLGLKLFKWMDNNSTKIILDQEEQLIVSKGSKLYNSSFYKNHLREIINYLKFLSKNGSYLTYENITNLILNLKENFIKNINKLINREKNLLYFINNQNNKILENQNLLKDFNYMQEVTKEYIKEIKNHLDFLKKYEKTDQLYNYLQEIFSQYDNKVFIITKELQNEYKESQSIIQKKIKEVNNIEEELSKTDQKVRNHLLELSKQLNFSLNEKIEKIINTNLLSGLSGKYNQVLVDLLDLSTFYIYDNVQYCESLYIYKSKYHDLTIRGFYNILNHLINSINQTIDDVNDLLKKDKNFLSYLNDLLNNLSVKKIKTQNELEEKIHNYQEERIFYKENFLNHDEENKQNRRFSVNEFNKVYYKIEIMLEKQLTENSRYKDLFNHKYK